jgi:hypothetical protein
VVSIEEVLNHPSAHVERICEWAQVPYVDTGFDYLNVPHHYIAGNFSVRRGKKNRVKHENCRWKTMLDTEMQSMIVEDPRVLAVAKKIGDLDPRAMQLFLNPNPVS